jgi:peroxiredoxin
MRQISILLFTFAVTSQAWLLHAQPVKLTIDPVQRPIKLGISGTLGGQYVLEKSSNPAGPSSWEFLLSLTLSESPQSWVDFNSVSASYRFYRLRTLNGSSAATASDFRLIDHEGTSRALNYYSTARAIVLVFVNGVNSVDSSALAALKTVRDNFNAAGVLVWMIDANAQSERTGTAALAKALGIDWPVLHDRAQTVAREFGVTTVPEAVAIDTADWTIFYRGAIENRTAAADAQDYLSNALENFLAAKPVTFTRTRPEGATITFAPLKTISYSAEIAPLLKEKCLSCHSPGNIAPWAMTNHAVVKSFSMSIKNEVLAGRMPPWHADPIHGAFANDASLKPAEAALLLDWIARGAPRGDGPDPLAGSFSTQPPPTDYPNAWPAELGRPDHVVSIPTQSLPTTGEIPYRYLSVVMNLPSNVWLRAASVLPGNTRAVHHALVFQGTLADFVRSGGGLSGYFAAYVPGAKATAFPEGTGKLLARNATLIFQMHYTTTGHPETDQTKLGLYFMKSPPPFELKTGAAATLLLAIPPSEPEYERDAQVMLSQSKDVWLYELAPHMHYRGSRFKFEAAYPDGSSEVLLSVPKYDFHWQTLYRLAHPKRLPAGTIVRCRGAFDNSRQNPDNPDPGVTVRFGEQTDDEMFIGYLNYAVIP